MGQLQFCELIKGRSSDSSDAEIQNLLSGPSMCSLRHMETSSWLRAYNMVTLHDSMENVYAVQNL